ncbi:uncharacterized protein LOC119674705 [Teleopsis dalmanni]|uniref:uncharacterized protein LOC119674705 n=1 Tax=Teleopsis dalmanni TaxID=139649 RepID=UPI0018CD8CCB|nr:uncharacterized protein LOC119674705 [Teleopsis dalmanni]
MSDEILNKETENSSTSTPEQRRSTVPDILRHQRSFEKRYSPIINKQILETSINKEALHRQMNAFFSCSRSPSPKNKKKTLTAGRNDSEAGASMLEEDSENNLADIDDKDSAKSMENTKVLQKLETLDIAEKN